MVFLIISFALSITNGFSSSGSWMVVVVVVDVVDVVDVVVSAAPPADGWPPDGPDGC